MDLYFPIPPNPIHLVEIPAPGTLCCKEVNDELLSRMQMIAREDLSEEQVESLVGSMSKKNILPWELYNQLLGYICPHSIFDFREFFDMQIKKNYVRYEWALDFITENNIK